MVDLLIIGAGLAGLSAAYSAAQAGLMVRVIAKGLGAMHWGAGTIDVLGYTPGTDRPVQAALDGIEALPDRHPYRLIGREPIKIALTSFAGWLNKAGLPYAGAHTDGANLWLPSPIGVARPVFLAPAGQLAGDLQHPEPILIAGFEGMRDFFPKLIAEHLTQLGYPARAVLLPLDLLTYRIDSNTVQLAQALDEPARQRALGVALRELARPDERIGLPAILGLERHREVVSCLQEQAGAAVFEIPTLPPSVPGVRLYRALLQQLASLRVRVEAGMEVIGFSAEGDRIRWVETETGARPYGIERATFCWLQVVS